ncbi:hypothetical protein SAY87_009198 [Trapa incisa]|uniref:DUF538 family protein n=1 Tax=Trapa incisa TaxID=236973 RepID=A0AAN7JXE3_9MYRT|nr:hypothetical protein SAY87_009198 [Trapa incisa]
MHPHERGAGKMQKPLPELLKEHDLPGGLFPGNNLTDYDFNDKTGLLTLELSNPWEVQYGDSSLLRFNTEVSGYLEKGKMTNVEGMKTKMVMMWVKVTLISAEGSDKVQFTAGMKKSRSREAYEALREGVAVDKF